ncbi:phenylacetic acid degradation bifunctional protein PaaZ [Litoreibacter roseus]|uniref:Bifunctional aldehyde dehydrogenase/enoyl-CoA hydratase n=1 Tax=Litoreibacter roseus TaxID=2601869 RepID=A0A6N6JDP2_9RHOB|nr:phenylacetic acid degradation bifunctional protein PaaZ [Litoreibacter roseus]GFE64326.1 bifunctional aldehyde dehydrogenase/enoyl-CoA hydratase [Litoreibacter roseus]
MTIQSVQSFAAGQWLAPDSGARPIESALTGRVIAEAGRSHLDAGVLLEHAKTAGGPTLRDMTFHDRARMVKALATYLSQHKQALYDLSYHTGGTLSDHKIDIDGGISTMFVIASKGRREMPDARVYIDGDVEYLSRDGSFLGQHICTPLQGVAVHINAFNFPVWGMLEKLAPTLLAGVPAIVKPATATCYVTEACVRLMLESGLLPQGALQFVAGGLGDMLDLLGPQDIVSFTGSAETALKLRGRANILENSVRFVAEQDSLNASVLGPDAKPETPEFSIFIKEVCQEITVKAGQKCTAVRRVFVPDSLLDAVVHALKQRLSEVVIGDPNLHTTGMGALVSASQKHDVLDKVSQISAEAERVFGDPNGFEISGDDVQDGAFLPPMLFHCADPDAARNVHDVEAFGPVSTIMGYRDLDHAIALLNRGKGSLVASVITRDTDVARQLALGSAAWHGRLYFNNRDSKDAATGHGSPLPHMVHGGPGRAGGGEELGGVRGVLHYMQRTAIQGSPDIVSAIAGTWTDGSREITEDTHPFTRTFEVLKVGETLHSDSRTVTLDDIETFARFTGDTFYAHMDEDAAAANPFFPGRVAHGYLLLSFAAGLFVQPDPGPVLANTGLDRLRFMKPVVPGDSIQVRLTVKQKTKRNDEYGEVRWDVRLSNQDNETVATYDLLTMNAYAASS